MTSISQSDTSPVLPLELVLRIMDELDLYADKRTFYRLSLAAQSYRLAAQWKLFCAVDFAFYFQLCPRGPYWTQDPTNDSNTVKQFLRTITAVPSLARAVKHFKITLHLRYDNTQPSLYTPSHPLPDILDELMCLKSLEIDSRSYLNWFWFTGQAKRGIERKIRSCPSLRMISFKGISALPQSVLTYPINLHTLVLSSSLGANSLFHQSFRSGQFTTLRNLTIAWERQTTAECDNSRAPSGSNSSDEAPSWKDPKEEVSTTELNRVYNFFTSSGCFISLAALTRLSIVTWSAPASDIQSLIVLCSKTVEDLSFLAPRECAFYQGVSEDGTYPNLYPPINIVDLSSVVNLSRLRITTRCEWYPTPATDDQSPIHKYSPLLWLGAVLQTLPDHVKFDVPIYIELRLALENMSFTSESYILPWSKIVEPLLSRVRRGSDHIALKLKCLQSIGKAAETSWLAWVESLKRDQAGLKQIGSSVIADNFTEIDVDEQWREQVTKKMDL